MFKFIKRLFCKHDHELLSITLDVIDKKGRNSVCSDWKCKKCDKKSVLYSTGMGALLLVSMFPEKIVE